jgi:hypothetical protein
MMLRSRMLAHIAAAGLVFAPGLGWTQAGALTHDPFARPAVLKAPPPSAQSRDNGGAGKGTMSEPAWKPELAAVMVAGPKSAVSIDGKIVRIGEEIDGHRLVEVHEQSAVFVRNRKKVTLSLRGLQLVPGAPPATTARPDAPPKQDAPLKPEGK